MEPIPWWGRVGETYYGPLQFTPEAREGLVRLVGPCVAYAEELPFSQLGLIGWRRSPLDARRFEQAVSERPGEATVRPLARFAEELMVQPVQRSDPRLRELDAIVGQLLQLGTTLHAMGYRLGYWTPRNLLVQREATGLRVLLPDLGFYNTTEDFEQPWLADDDEFAALCSPGRPTAQHLPHGLERTGPQPDIRMLARMLACVLLGGSRPGNLLPRQSGSPWVVLTEIPPLSHAPTLRADIWGVLQRAIAGEFSSMEEFARQVQLHPASDHFRALAPRSRSLGKWVVGTALLAALLVGGMVGARWLEPPVVESNGSGATEGGDPSPAGDPHPEQVSERLKPLEEGNLAGLTPNLHAQAIVTAYASGTAGVEVETPTAKGVLQRARQLLVEKIRHEIHRKLDDTDPTPVNRRLLAGYVQTQADALRAVQRFPADPSLASEEQKCLEELGRLLQELQD